MQAKLLIFHTMLTIVYFFTVIKTYLALEVLRDNSNELENDFRQMKISLNGTKTENITFTLKNNKKFNGSETVTVGTTVVKKSE